MNSVIVLGRLTKDPKGLTTNSGKNLCKFDIAVNSGYGESAKTDYIPITVFGNIATNCIKFLTKGSQVAVEGKLNSGSYEKDGRTIHTLDVLANKVEFLSKKNTETQPHQTTLDELHEVEDDEIMPF